MLAPEPLRLPPSWSAIVGLSAAKSKRNWSRLEWAEYKNCWDDHQSSVKAISFTMLLTPSPVLPPLPTEEYEALKDHIAHNGVQKPILVTSKLVIIDGHERYRVITELGLRKYPIRVVGDLSEKERREMAIALNLLRRHLSRAERQNWLEELIRLNPQKSSRDLASAAKVSQSTAARAKVKVLGTESNDSVEIRGRNGKTYKYKPAVSVENPQSAQKAANLLESLREEAPEGGIDLRKAQKLAERHQKRASPAGGKFKPPARPTSSCTTADSKIWSGSPTSSQAVST